MKILLVDDNSSRIQYIRSIVPKGCKVEYVVSRQEALSKMKGNFYDIVVVDLMIPNFSNSQTASVDSGRNLIEAIINVTDICSPFQIVAVTIEEDLYEKNLEFFQNHLIPFVYCDNDKKWGEYLLSLINRVERVSEIFNKQIDVAIITAVEDEWNAVKDLPIQWKDYQPFNSIGLYKIGTYFIGEDEKTVALVRLNSMGLVSAAEETAQIISIFHPKIVCMCGICAGVKGRVEKGDLIVAERSWDYGNGKILPAKKGKFYYDFNAEPKQVAIDRDLLGIIQNNLETCFQQANADWLALGKNEIQSTIRIGAMPSGAAVVQDEALVENVVKPQYRTCMGLDMETFAVYQVCNNSKFRPKFLSLKSVVDFADISKDDSFHEYCSFTSAKTLYYFLQTVEISNIL